MFFSSIKHLHDWDSEGFPNVRPEVKIEEQMYFHRAEALAKISSKILIISAEPKFEEMDFLVAKNSKRIIDDFQWIILGGESGDETGEYRYRPSEIAWYERAINDKKPHNNVAVYMKQVGSHLKKTMGLSVNHGEKQFEWPKNLRIKEFPLYGRFKNLSKYISKKIIMGLWPHCC